MARELCQTGARRLLANWPAFDALASVLVNTDRIESNTSIGSSGPGSREAALAVRKPISAAKRLPESSMPRLKIRPADGWWYIGHAGTGFSHKNSRGATRQTHKTKIG